MGTQQSRSGHGRQGSQQASQQTDRRPEQDRDLQRVKQSDRGQQHQSGDVKRQPSQGSTSNRQPSQGDSSSQQGQPPETQQSQLGGHRDFEHRMENEGREQNRMQQAERSQMSQQNAKTRESGQRESGSMDALRGGGEHGEGSYAGTRQYDKAVKDFAASGRVEEAARAAAPRTGAEAREMEAAEAEGKRHAKGEDPALKKGGPRPRREEN